MHLFPSKAETIAHKVHETDEQYVGVPLRHSPQTPFYDKNIKVNPDRPMRPCAVAMIQDEASQKILATQRPLNITFGGKWVMPGGHLERGETVVEGGIRECVEEVNLDKKAIRKVDKDCIMAWESVFHVNDQIKATALVFFFRIEAGAF